jgi:hypothetical protein
MQCVNIRLEGVLQRVRTLAVCNIMIDFEELFQHVNMEKTEKSHGNR